MPKIRSSRSHPSLQPPRTPPRPTGTHQSSDTPRSGKGDVGSIGQNHIRSDIAQQMADEMLCCDIDQFLCHYAPFCPTNDSIDSALKQLKHKGLLLDNGWRDFRGNWTNMKETEAFKKLEDIVKALTGQKCFSTDSKAPRKCNFNYHNCGYSHMVGEIPGSTFRIDGYFSPKYSRPLFESTKVVVSQVAVAAEFKREKEDSPQNRRQLVSAVNQIMNDDPRRMWMYGITIEDEAMAVWYFSRSHSVMSRSFDFTKKPKKIVTVLLSLLFATELEMGYDPTVHRIMFKNKIRYVYDLTQESGETLHFRTTATIFNPRIACISGRKTRVWRAIQVTGSDGLEEKGDKEVVLKDVWLDKGSPTEKENQDLIYENLQDIKQRQYEWLEDKYRKRVGDALEKIPDNLPFMRILHGAKGVDCKERLKEALPDRTILSPAVPRVSSSRNVTPLASQIENSYPATGTSHGASATPDHRHRPQRQYKAKTQYRLVYAQVGYALHDAPSIDKAFKAINDVLTALILLFMAGWVHRDISTGNIIVVEDNGCIRGFLSDFEYAKAMSNQSSSSDPKTGTPYFMPLEIHRGERYARPRRKASSQSYQEREENAAKALLHPPNLHITILRYNYNHDHESLMWVALYIVFGRVDLQGAQHLCSEMFVNSLRPSLYREHFFQGVVALPPGAFHSALPDFPLHFETIRSHLWDICEQLEPQEEDYHKLFDTLIIAFDKLLATSNKKSGDVPFVIQSGQVNVEVKEPTKKQKTEHTPHRMTLRRRDVR